jgi:hypothetical protein
MRPRSNEDPALAKSCSVTASASASASAATATAIDGEAARLNPLWQPLERILQDKVGADGTPLDPAIRNYILLITILVAFLKAAIQQLSPQPPVVVMRFAGIHPPLGAR